MDKIFVCQNCGEGRYDDDYCTSCGSNDLHPYYSNKSIKQELIKFLKYWTDKYCDPPYDDEIIEYFIDLYIKFKQ